LGSGFKFKVNHSLWWILLLLFAASLQAADLQDIWPAQVSPLKKEALALQLAALGSTVPRLPDTLEPALDFQKIFLQIISGVPASVWRADLEKLAVAPGGNPVVEGVREAARAWFARLQMADIDQALRLYYRAHVQFPATLAEIEGDLPQTLRKDPWGEPWIYKPLAPQGFERLAMQRYQLGPTRFPNLAPLPEALTRRKPETHSWTISLRDAAGKKALEFRSPEKGATVAIIEPGGKIDGCVLLYIGNNWALMAGVDDLFAVGMK